MIRRVLKFRRTPRFKARVSSRVPMFLRLVFELRAFFGFKIPVGRFLRAVRHRFFKVIGGGRPVLNCTRHGQVDRVRQQEPTVWLSASGERRSSNLHGIVAGTKIRTLNDTCQEE